MEVVFAEHIFLELLHGREETSAVAVVESMVYGIAEGKEYRIIVYVRFCCLAEAD